MHFINNKRNCKWQIESHHNLVRKQISRVAVGSQCDRLTVAPLPVAAHRIRCVHGRAGSVQRDPARARFHHVDKYPLSGVVRDPSCIGAYFGLLVWTGDGRRTLRTLVARPAFALAVETEPVHTPSAYGLAGPGAT